MNLKDRVIRKLLDFGKKHRLMVYPMLALVAVVSAVSQAIYTGKGNKKRVVASVMVVALLITQSLFLTSSASGDNDTSSGLYVGSTNGESGDTSGDTSGVTSGSTDGVSGEQAGTGDTSESTEAAGDTGSDTQDGVAQTGDTSGSSGSENNDIDQLNVTQDSYDLMGAQDENKITVNYYFAVNNNGTYTATELGSSTTVLANASNQYVVALPEGKATLAFGDSSQSNYFTFSDWNTDINCNSSTGISGNSITLDLDDSRISNGALNLYFTAARTEYPVYIMDGDTKITKEISILSPVMGVVNPSVTYTVEAASAYNAYKTGYKYSGLNYGGASYVENSSIKIAPTGYVSSINMTVEYAAYTLPVTFDAAVDSNTDKGIVVEENGDKTLKISYTYDGGDITLPDSTMNGNVSSEAYYISAWSINGEEYTAGSTINSNILFSANSEVKDEPNITAYTPTAVWAYKDVKLESNAATISVGENGQSATVTTTYGDTLSAALNACYKTNEDGTKFHYSISDTDNAALGKYGISYSTTTASTTGGTENTGIVFSTSGYVSDVPVNEDHSFLIDVTVTDDNKSDATYTFPVTFVINPKTISVDGTTVMSSNNKDKPNKTYDGLTNIDVYTTADLTGVLDADSDKVSVTFASSATLDDANAGTDKNITLSDVSLDGDAAYKYKLNGLGSDKTLTIEGIGTVDKCTLSLEMSLADGETDKIYFGESTPDYVLKLTEDSISKLSTADQTVYATYLGNNNTTEFIKNYIGFTGFQTDRTYYSSPSTYSIIPDIDSTGKNYTVDASGLSAKFTVLRLDGTNEYTLVGTKSDSGYYSSLSVTPTNGYSKIRRVTDGKDIAAGTDPSVVAALGWGQSIDIENMTDGTISFQMMSESGAITEIVTLNDINVDRSLPVLEKVYASPETIKEYIKEFGFGSYYHTHNGVESINIRVYYSSEKSDCETLYYYFIDESGNKGSVTSVAFDEDKTDGYYTADFNIGTGQKGELVVYAVNEANGQSSSSKIKLDKFSDLISDTDYYEWIVENNIDSAAINVTDADGNTAVTSTDNSALWYNELNLTVDASDAESGVDKITWKIDTPSGVISPNPTQSAHASALEKIADKAYKYTFKYTISGDDMPAGSYTVSAVFEDNAGNTAQLATVGPFNVDCKAPAIDVDAIADSDIYQSGVTLSFNVTEGENESGIAYIRLVRVDGSNEATVREWLPSDDTEKYSLDCEYTIVESGTYKIIACDVAGNTVSTSRTFNKLSNTVPDTPVITVDGTIGSDGWYKGEAAPVAAIECQTVTDDGVKVTTYYKITTDAASSQMPVASGTSRVEFDIEAQGEVEIEAWSVSEAGIESTHATKTVNIDTAAPTIEIVNASVGDDGDMYINYRIKDATSKVDTGKVYLNGTACEVTEETNAVTGSFKADDSKTYSLVAYDNAGNCSEEFTYEPLTLDVSPVTDITTSGAYLEAVISEGTYDVTDYYIAYKKHSDTSYRTCLINDSTSGNDILINTMFRDLASDTVYDYKVYAVNEKSEAKTYEGHFRTLNQRASGSVYGSVTYDEKVTDKDYPVYVSLYEANTFVASTRLDSGSDTEYLFTNLSDGSYRVVATNGVLTKTAAVTISNGGISYPSDYAENAGINLVLNGYSTSVVIEDDAINITADELDSIYDNSFYEGILTRDDIAVLDAGGTMDISLHASYIDVSDISSEELGIFDVKLADNTVIERYINLYVLKEVKNADGEYVNNTPSRISELVNPITISFPLGDLSGQTIYVASVHGEGSDYSFLNWSNADDVVITDNYVTITTRYFSVYALYRVVPTDKTYQVVWKDGDGNTMKTETVKEGEAATPPDETPVKSPTAKYRYEFSGWDLDYSSVTSDMIISARFTAWLINSSDDNKDDNGGDTNKGNNGGTDNSNNGGNAGTQSAGGNAAVSTTPNSYTYLGSADSPKTGDTLPVAVIAVIMLTAGAGIVVLKRIYK